jgi:hypothetical protein
LRYLTVPDPLVSKMLLSACARYAIWRYARGCDRTLIAATAGVVVGGRLSQCVEEDPDRSRIGGGASQTGAWVDPPGVRLPSAGAGGGSAPAPTATEVTAVRLLNTRSTVQKVLLVNFQGAVSTAAAAACCSTPRSSCSRRRGEREGVGTTDKASEK